MSGIVKNIFGSGYELSLHFSMEIFRRFLNLPAEKISAAGGRTHGICHISRVWGRHSPTRFPMGQNEQDGELWYLGRILL